MKDRKTGNIVTTIVLLLICVALVIAIIVKMFQPKASISFGRPEVVLSASSNVYVKEIAPERFVRTLKFYGKANDDSSELSIVTRAAGYVSEILVSDNDEVKEGQVIGYIDPSSPGATYQKSAVTARVDGRIENVEVSVGTYVSAGSVFATEKEEE